MSNTRDYLFEKVINRNGFFLISNKSMEEYKEKDSRFLQKLEAKGIKVEPAALNHYKLFV